MDPSYRSTICNQKERPKKRSNGQTNIPYADDEERESKRNRMSPLASGPSMYARTPQGLYQQPKTKSNNDQLDIGPYATNRSTNASSYHQAPVEPSSHHAQDSPHDRQKRYEKIASGLGRSMLNPQPFQEESDSSDNDGLNEAAGQEEEAGSKTSPLFVYSSEDTGASNAASQAQNSHSDDVFSIYSGEQQSYTAHAQNASFSHDDSYSISSREQLPPTMRHQLERVKSQSQPVTSPRVRLNPPNTAQLKHASNHGQARDPRSIPQENTRSDHRPRPEMPSADTATKQQSKSRAHCDGSVVSQPPVNKLSTPAAQSSQKYAIQQSPPSGVLPTPIGTTRPSRHIPEGFRAPKNILSSVKPPKSHTDRQRPRQFQEDLDYPAETTTSPVYHASVALTAPIIPITPTPIAPIAQPTARYNDSLPVQQPDSSTSSSVQDVASKIPEEQLRRFVPNALDNQVWGYRHREIPMDWDQIKEILDLTGTTYVLTTLKTRQQIYEAKRKLKDPEQIAADRAVAGEITASVAMLAGFPSTPPTRPTIQAPAVQAPTVQAPTVQAPAIQADARILAATLEQERLAWVIKEAEYQERIKIVEEASAAKTAELKEQEKQLKLKVEVQEKYQKLKEEAQTHKENLKDEKALRVKAERDLKTAQSDINRRALAAAGAARNKGKATDTGFSFSNDAEDGEDEDVQKKTPVKRSKSRKPSSNSDLREDGHPRTAGKSLPPAAIQALYKRLNSCKEEEVEEPPEFIQEEELSYFVYTVYRKQWLNDEQEPDDDGDTKIACGNYTYLNEANAAVTNEILCPHGTASAIRIDPNQDRSLHQGMAEHNMSWALLDVPEGHVRVWVRRQLHTEFEGKLPLFEDKGILTKTVFAIKQETSTGSSDTATPTTTIEEGEEIYTTLGLANIKANEKVFNLLWPEDSPGSSARKTTLTAVKAKEEARQERKQRLEDLEDHGQLFTEEVDKQDGSKVKIFVVQKTVTGPRN
jgi:hypothetical protein